MKKTYERPQIVFESFELSQSIAAECLYITNAARGTCAIDTGDGIGMLFTSSVDACEYEPGPGMHDDICYDNPGENPNVFSS